MTHTKDSKTVLDAAWPSTQQYKVRIKGKVEQSWEWSSALLYISVSCLVKKEPSGHPRQGSPSLFTYIHSMLRIWSYTCEYVCMNVCVWLCVCLRTHSLYNMSKNNFIFCLEYVSKRKLAVIKFTKQ